MQTGFCLKHGGNYLSYLLLAIAISFLAKAADSFTIGNADFSLAVFHFTLAGGNFFLAIKDFPLANVHLPLALRGFCHSRP
ncbi:MAG: hypothetical protein EOP49_01445 [Sphingobacteriales bacterium]|nr:MAG: hypothetical protein EOP49_01445 [Sphingobacteriales bacterium]